ncbi:MAG: heavy metal-responsive transcriptional regulator [Miltoncostaeaceae bacterium]
MTVSKLGARAGVSPDTVRYYERLGLLPAAERSESGYRLYDEGAVARLRQIRQAQSLGLKLSQIGELLQTLDGGECPCAETVEAMTERRSEIDAEIGRLTAMRDQLDAAIDAGEAGDCCDPCEDECVPTVLTPREEVSK